MRVCVVAVFLTVRPVISRFIPPRIRPLEHTQCSCLSPHINSFLSFLSPPGWKSAGCLRERSLNFSPVFQRWEEKKGRGKESPQPGEHRSSFEEVNKITGCGLLLRFLIRKLNCIRMTIAPLLAVTSCSIEKFCHAFHNFSPHSVSVPVFEFSLFQRDAFLFFFLNSLTQIWQQRTEVEEVWTSSNTL